MDLLLKNKPEELGFRPKKEEPTKDFIDLILQHENTKGNKTPFKITHPSMRKWTSMFDDTLKIELDPKANQGSNFLHLKNEKDKKALTEEQFRRWVERNPEITVENAVNIFDQSGAGGKLNFLKQNGINIKSSLKDNINLERPKRNEKGEFDLNFLNPFAVKEAGAEEMPDFSEFGFRPKVVEKKVEEKDLIKDLGFRPKEKKDIPEHKDVENVVKKASPGFFRNIAESFKRGERSSSLDTLQYDALLGVYDYKKDIKPLKEKFQAKVQGDPIQGNNLLSQAIYSVSEMLPAMGKGIVTGKGVGAAYGLGAAAVSPPGTRPVTIPAAFAVGTLAGSMNYWYRQGAGSLYGDLVDEGVEDNIARPIAHMAGALYGAVEFSQVDKLIPGSKEATKRLFSDSFKKVVGKMVRKYGANWAQEVGEEGIQEVIMTSAREIGKRLSGKTNAAVGSIAYKSMIEGWKAVKDSAIPMMLLLGPSAGVDVKRIAVEEKVKKAVREDIAREVVDIAKAKEYEETLMAEAEKAEVVDDTGKLDKLLEEREPFQRQMKELEVPLHPAEEGKAEAEKIEKGLKEEEIDRKFPELPEEVKQLETNDLEKLIEQRYEAGANQEELDALETLFAERVTEDRIDITEEDVQMSEEAGAEGANLEIALEELYHTYLKPENKRVGSFRTNEEIINAMKVNIEHAEAISGKLKKKISDKEALDAAKEIYQKKQELRKRVAFKQEAVKDISDLFSVSEGPQIIQTEEGYKRLGSGWPTFLTNKGYNRKQLETIFKKFINGEPLTVKQQGIINTVVRDYKQLKNNVEKDEVKVDNDLELLRQRFPEIADEDIREIEAELDKEELWDEERYQKAVEKYIEKATRGTEGQREVLAKESKVTPSGQVRPELQPPIQKELFQEKGELFEEVPEKPAEPSLREKKSVTYGSGASGSMAAVSKGQGYGTIEPSEKATKEKQPKTDYTQIAQEIPWKKEGFQSFQDDFLQVFSPGHREGAREAARVLRMNISELAHKDVAMTEKTKKLHRAFTWMGDEDSLEFIYNMEEGNPQKTPELQDAAVMLREALDNRRETVQNLGKGHLEAWIENYFPHIWKDPRKAKDVIAQIMGRKRLEGTKAFLKKRVIVSTRDGISRGLEPVSYNPVDLVLLKIHEMDRYIMAQNMIQQLRGRQLVKFVYSRGKAPEGYIKVNDNAFTVYHPPEMTKKDYYDQHMVDQLMDVAQSLGVDTRRFVSIGGKRLGYAQWFPGMEGGEKIRTKYASPESVLAHEIGHILGYRYNLYSELGRRMEGEYKVHKKGKKAGEEYFKPTKEAVEYRGKIDPQWRALADARAKGLDPKKYPGFFKYIRKGREKEAVMLEALMHAPEEFKRVAPDLYKVFTDFLNSQSELRPILDIKPSLVLGENEAKIKIPGFTTLGHYYAPEPVGSLLNNYLSPGLKNSQNRLIGSGYNMLRGAGNVMNQAQLAWSLFHGLNVTSDMAISTFGLGIRRMFTKGQRFQGLKDIASVPISPITTIWQGQRIRNQYIKSIDEIKDPEMRTMVEAIIKAGGRDRMDVFYYNQQLKALEKTFRDIAKGDALTKTKGIAKLPFNLFGSLFEVAAKPLMEWYVPTGKIGLFAKLAQHEMERAESGQIDEEQLFERLTSSWDSVDNRMGQLIYDNLFWNKTLRDTAMLTIRSTGWNLGSWREFGGAFVDVAATQNRINRGDLWLSHKMAYSTSAVVIYSILGAVIQKILTGDDPEEPRDYLFPKTGRKNPDGSDERLSLPTYAKDWWSWSHRPVQTAIHKIHPLWGALGDITENKDFFNVEIRHEGDPVWEQGMDVAKYIAKSFMSISMKNYEKMEKASPDEKLKNALVSITGITSAPSYITRSPAQKLMTRYIADKIPQGARTSEQYERSLYRKTLITRIRKGEQISNKEAIDILGASSVSRLKKEARMEPFAASFNRLGLREALDVYAIATPAERKQVKNILRRKYSKAQNYNKTEEIRAAYQEALKLQ